MKHRKQKENDRKERVRCSSFMSVRGQGEVQMSEAINKIVSGLNSQQRGALLDVMVDSDKVRPDRVLDL